MHATSAQDWATLIKQQEISGQSALKWCREHQVNYDTFLYHRRRLTPMQINNKDFIELHDDTSDPTWIEISIRGAKLSLAKRFNKAVLIRLLEVLRKL